LCLDYARDAYNYSFSYPKTDFYPPEEWALEVRSAPVKAVALMASLLNEADRFDDTIILLEDLISNHPLTIEDETTLGRCYYYLAEAYHGVEWDDLAETYAVKALVAGDSRNKFTPMADTLLTTLLSEHRGVNLNLDYARKIMNYNDVEFKDVTFETGLENVNAGRIAWGDYNNDGWQDILLNGSRLFRNDQGRYFTEVTSIAFSNQIEANGGLWGDFDNDGDLDIITKDPESLWVNDSGLFNRNRSMMDNAVSTEGIGIGDVNRDGHLDIYFANYEKDYVYETDQFYLGGEYLSFKEAAAEYGLLPDDGVDQAGRGVSPADYDNDGDLDIFVSNYRLTRNFLWQNDGMGNFKDMALKSGVSGIEKEDWWGHTIGSEWGDLDNDGDLDLVSCNLAHPRYIDSSDKTMLLYNSGFPDYNFTDRRSVSGIKFEETNSDPALGDLNNDGYLDLYITNVYSGRRSFLYMNNGDGTFRDVTYLSGTRHFNGWGVAYADFDNDGDLDMLVAGGEIQLLRNDTFESGNWLQIQVVGKDHSDAIGTRLELRKGDVTLIREIQGGKGTTNQHSLVQHFGLGDMDPPFDLTVRFPSGEIRRSKLEDINRIVKIVE